MNARTTRRPNTKPVIAIIAMMIILFDFIVTSLLLFDFMSRQMYHHKGDKTTVSLKIRQSVGVCIIMNNQEKNTYVRTQLLTTLLDMMKKEDFNSISISSLVAEAKVGRASFYRNYSTKEDILRDEAERLNKELELIRKDDNPYDVRLKLIRTLDFYKAHEDFYSTLYKAGQTKIIQDSIVNEEAISKDNSVVRAYISSAFSYLIYGWIIEWIKRGMKETSDEIIAMFESTKDR